VAGFAWLAPRGAGAQSNPTEMDLRPPALTGGTWLNTPGGKAVSLASRRGKVTVLHFWTFG
jgi:hypothetical protein